MKHIVLAALITILPAPVLSCTLNKEWYEDKQSTFAEYDADKDGKWVLDEYLEYMDQYSIPESTKRSSWKSLLERVTTESYLTTDEYVASQRPKCAG